MPASGFKASRFFLAAAAVFGLALMLANPGSVTAAAPCHSIKIEGTKDRVATVRAPCKEAREIASAYFERTLSGDRFDGITDDGSIYYDVAGFRCLTGLGGSQMFCRHHDRRIYASSRPEDHPVTWRRSEARGAAAQISSRRVYFVIGCSGSIYQPNEIALTCADGKVRFEATEGWEEWGSHRASTHGTLRFPICASRVPLVACQNYAEDEAALHLWRPVYCANVGHWQFTRLRVEDLAGPGPEGFDRPVEYPCQRFKPEPIHRLGSSAARDYMLSILNRHFSYEARASGSIKCNRHISDTRRACKMSWVTGDSGYIGRGQIWLTFRRHEKQAHFSYRLTLVDEYCLFVTHEGDCTKMRSSSGLVPGAYRRARAQAAYWTECEPAASHQVQFSRTRSTVSGPG